MASIGAKLEAAKAKKQHVFQGERVQAFSDAVFAIVATFAVIPLKLSRANVIQSEGGFRHFSLENFFKDQWPRYFIYLYSFALIVDVWICHVSIFGLAEQVNDGVLWLNLVCLLLVTFLPFSTGLVSSFPDNSKDIEGEQTAISIAAGDIAAIGLSLIILAFYIFRRQALVHPEIANNPHRRSLKWLALLFLSISPLLALLALGFSFLTTSPVIGLVLFYMILVVSAISKIVFYILLKIKGVIAKSKMQLTFRMNKLRMEDEFSFCLWQGANTLDIFSFKYLTILYSVTLVIITVILKKCGKGKCLVRYRRQNLQRSESSKSSVKSTMIHSFSAFFVMCYSQCAKVTLFILTPGRVHSIGSQYHHKITPVVFYHGDFKYFGHDHIKYAIPALMFAIILVLILPLLLVVYPLCYKVLALLRIEETRCVNILCRILPLERMKPMFDSFQSCFKDKYRFFAGLYFFYRLVALVSFVFADSLTKFYIALEVQLIVMLTLQAITYPYRRRWHNIIDILLFANLAVINAMIIYNYKKSKERNLDARSVNAVSTIQTILVSTLFVCMVCFVIIQLALKVKRARKSEDQCRDERTDTVLALVDYREMEESKSLEY